MLDVDVAVDDGLAEIEEEEHGHHGEDESHEVSRDHQVDLAIALKRGEGMIPAVSRGLSAECDSLLSETLNVLVDVALELGLDLTALHKLHHLLLLLVERGVLSSNLAEALIDIVLEAGTHIYLS